MINNQYQAIMEKTATQRLIYLLAQQRVNPRYLVQESFDAIRAELLKRKLTAEEIEQKILEVTVETPNDLTKEEIRHKRNSRLKGISDIIKFMVKLSLILLAIPLTFGLFTDRVPFSYAFYFTIFSGFSSLLLYAFADLILVALDIEENTRYQNKE